MWGAQPDCTDGSRRWLRLGLLSALSVSPSSTTLELLLLLLLSLRLFLLLLVLLRLRLRLRRPPQGLLASSLALPPSSRMRRKAGRKTTMAEMSSR